MSNTDIGTMPRNLMPSVRIMADNWWLVLVRGIIAILFGIAALALPGLTLLSLTLLWGAFALIDGAFALWHGITGRTESGGMRWWLAIVGIIGILAGIVTFVAPVAVTAALLLYIGIWAIIVGAMEIWGAIWLRREIENEWWLGLAGALTILFGVILLFEPAAGALGIVWLIAAFGIIVGISLVALAFRLRSFRR
ncbi:MAG TPA: HdeD family acid-resistance protein [Devosia sp.]|nr:HdeD family acid-resistance protein [Devosia sp.]